MAGVLGAFAAGRVAKLGALVLLFAAAPFGVAPGAELLAFAPAADAPFASFTPLFAGAAPVVCCGAEDSGVGAAVLGAVTGGALFEGDDVCPKTDIERQSTHAPRTKRTLADNLWAL
ncbi:MAG TPA: hypothetical protein VGC88_12490 [Terriglobales bacterium]